jgi:mRNA-degrading endonuclease RelE of RelBE toxin-antitoxin system
MIPEGTKSAYHIDLPKRVARQLDKIPNKDYLSVSKAIQNLKQNPRSFGSKKLYESLYRIRVGDYRVLYWIRVVPETGRPRPFASQGSHKSASGSDYEPQPFRTFL